MKLVLFAILGLLLGVGGGAAMSVMNAKKSFAAYDARRARVVADSIEQAAQHPAGADSTAAAPGDSSHATPGDTTHGGAIANAATSKDGHAPAPVAAADAHAPATATATPPGGGRQRATATVEAHGGTLPAGTPQLVKRGTGSVAPTPGQDKLGRIFAAMPAKEAARVLEQLSDADVHEILGSLSDKQAAGIMQFLPSPRAASISKLALKGGHE